MTVVEKDAEIVEVELVFEDETPPAGPYAQRADRTAPSAGTSRTFDATTGSGEPAPGWPQESTRRADGLRALPWRAQSLVAALVLTCLVMVLAPLMVAARPVATVVVATSLVGGGLWTLSSTLVQLLLGPVGAAACVGATHVVLRRGSDAVKPWAVLVAMGLAWVVNGLVGMATLWSSGMHVSALAFAGAAATVAVSATSERRLTLVAGVATVLDLTISALLVLTGAVSVLGATTSLTVGVLSAGLGVHAWNRWGAPLADGHRRAHAFMRAAGLRP
ncbi:hypothetical protein I6B53_01090 [Schaalia sp. 19OD2882]|uniref:hypothetical protein n=1 Tax=Schaalia sp. 19OD2882 TaxID=2794089 RepID=UPI001C1EF916|nr:hypothetical protein [Schaalia sp. 19OD2882]QWW19761.1 hypothetical protein I6B53_01090 [Schaalia sp. 19OD2882]